MNYLLKFTQEFPAIVADMKACEHNSDYHIEGSIWTHTCMVYTYVQALHPDNKVLLLSAILHDIGKVQAHAVVEGKTRFFGHEGYSTFLARDILNKFDCTDQEIIDILNVVSLHGVNVSQLDSIPYLSMFRKADGNSRIALKYHTDYSPRKFHKPHSNPTHTVTILCGLPCSGKSTYAIKHDNVISRDLFMMLHYGDKSEDYNTVYKEVHSDLLVLADFNKAFDKHLTVASKWDTDITIDMTMLSLKDRRSMMSRFPNARFKCVVFLPSLTTIMERNEARKGKYISETIYDRMMSKFVMPTKAEGFENIQYILN